MKITAVLMNLIFLLIFLRKESEILSFPSLLSDYIVLCI